MLSEMQYRRTNAVSRSRKSSNFNIKRQCRDYSLRQKWKICINCVTGSHVWLVHVFLHIYKCIAKHTKAYFQYSNTSKSDLSLQATHDVEIVTCHQIYYGHLAGCILLGHSAGDSIRSGADAWRTIVHGKFEFVNTQIISIEYEQCNKYAHIQITACLYKIIIISNQINMSE